MFLTDFLGFIAIVLPLKIHGGVFLGISDLWWTNIQWPGALRQQALPDPMLTQYIWRHMASLDHRYLKLVSDAFSMSVVPMWLFHAEFLAVHFSNLALLRLLKHIQHGCYFPGFILFMYFGVIKILKHPFTKYFMNGFHGLYHPRLVILNFRYHQLLCCPLPLKPQPWEVIRGTSQGVGGSLVRTNSGGRNIKGDDAGAP